MSIIRLIFFLIIGKSRSLFELGYLVAVNNSTTKPYFVRQAFVISVRFDLVGIYAYYLRKIWVYALSVEGPLNSTRLI